MKQRSDYSIAVCHPCGHVQEHRIKGWCQGQAYEVARENYFPILCDDCLDASGTRGNPERFEVKG